jgi:hypothetical protein
MSQRESRRQEPPEVNAYRQAWKSRKATQEDSPKVLEDEWSRIGYTPTEGERDFWLAAWTSSIAPRRLGTFLLRWTGREFVSFAREFREILNDPELPDWLIPPPEFKMLSVGAVSGNIKKRAIQFTADPEPSAVLDRMLDLPPKKDGYRKVRVWLNPDKDESMVSVMAGVSRVGWTSLDRKQMRSLRPKLWARKTKVADGNLKFLLSPNGELTSAKLKMHLPPP